jgi:hypothetical protein
VNPIDALKPEEEAVEKPVALFYGIISGKADDPRDWDKFRGLFIPNAVLSIRRTGAHGEPQISSFSIAEYIDNLKKFLGTRDFYEFTSANDTRIFRDIACVRNTYEAYSDSGKQSFLKKGTNLISLVFDGTDWKIAAMLWQDGV